MGIITINGIKYEFTDEKNVLTIIRNAGIEIPTLCYHPELSTFGACRLCTVEDDKGRFFASCSEEPRDGMVIYTHTPTLRRYRKLIIELLLASHHRDCTACDKHGKCVLQKLAYQHGINSVRFENHKDQVPVDFSSPAIVRDPNKCVLCGNCVRACNEIQGIGVLGFAHRGTNTTVGPAFDKMISQTKCVGCGQCKAVCPTGALTVYHSMSSFWEALDDPNTRVVAQIAPAVRVAVGEAFGLPRGENVMGKIVAALHRMGVDHVFDTSYTADLTIMEETAEFLERVKEGKNLPLMTSCCPAWVKFVDNEFPEFKPNISSCRSPQQMFSAIIKDHYRRPENSKGKKTFVVSLMPCSAKKMEAERPNSYTYGVKDTDYVLTTEEFVRMIDGFGFSFKELDGQACDMPFGIGSGAGVIFGASGGVTEAVLRRLSADHYDQSSLSNIAQCGVRGPGEIREFTVPYGGIDVNICVVSGLANARMVLEQVKSGEKQYHMIEVMACPGGCVMGGGQPADGAKHKRLEDRTQGIYKADGAKTIKRSDENPLMGLFYSQFDEDKIHELCHNHE